MIAYYRRLLTVDDRLRVFKKAIESEVRNGDTVCEIGTGLGTYAFMASHQGAAKVYAVDDGPVLEVAENLYTANRDHLGDIEFIKGYSTDIHLPGKADIVIYENFESLGLAHEQERVLDDARKRFLKPGGTFIPHAMAMYWAPIQSEAIWTEHITSLENNGENVEWFDFSLTRELVQHCRIVTSLEADTLLCPPMPMHRVDFALDPRLSFQHEAVVDITRPGIFHGFGAWVDLLFPGGHTFSLSYEKPLTTFSRSFFPLPEPVDVEPGDKLRLKVSVIKKNQPIHIWSWQGDVAGRSGKRKTAWQSSTFHVLPFQPDDNGLPKRLPPESTPRLNLEGNIRKHILDSLDGNTRLETIAAQLLAEYPGQFCSRDHAMGKVVRVAKKCSGMD